MAGIPNMAWSHITRWAGGDSGGHIGFSPVVPMTGSEILRARGLLRARSTRRAWTTSPGCSAINARSLIHITMLMFDTADEARHAQRLRARASGSSSTARRTATASTAPTSTSWTRRPPSTRSATTPTAASARRSRTRSTRQESSRPERTVSGPPTCGADPGFGGAAHALSPRVGACAHPRRGACSPSYTPDQRALEARLIARAPAP